VDYFKVSLSWNIRHALLKENMKTVLYLIPALNRIECTTAAHFAPQCLNISDLTSMGSRLIKQKVAV
jgi:hypothetical protein